MTFLQVLKLVAFHHLEVTERLTKSNPRISSLPYSSPCVSHQGFSPDINFIILFENRNPTLIGPNKIENMT
jgi:hypothetical protein